MSCWCIVHCVLFYLPKAEMEIRVSGDSFAGFLEMEVKENSGDFVRKFVRLDTSACKLEYFHENVSKENVSLAPMSSFF